MPRARPRLDAATARRIAVAASCDPRTVLREFLRPGAVRGLPGSRIREALLSEGLLSNDSGMLGGADHFTV